MLQGLSDLYELVELALWSGRLHGERAVSLLLCSEPETGKSSLLAGFGHIDGVYWANDATAWGIARQIKTEINNGDVRCIVVPDLLQSLAHKAETVEGFLTFMNGLVEEGEARVVSYVFQAHLKSPKPLGFITAIPMGEFLQRRKKWQQFGFTSRMLPVSWSYSSPMMDMIYQQIESHATAMARIEVEMPLVDVPVDLPYQLARRLEPSARALGHIEGVYGFRYQKHFQRLAKASALKRSGGKPTAVTEADVELVLRLIRFCNLNQTAV